MDFIKYETDFGPLYKIKEDQKELAIYLASNLDLYWYFSCNGEDNIMTITKDNNIYSLFEQLFMDIENINIFRDEDSNIPFCFNDKYIQDKYIKQKAIDQKLKVARYKRHNISNYNNLFDEDNKRITWTSDDSMDNKLLIKKEEDSYILDFKNNDNNISIPIRFKSRGSRYGEFYLLFMRMYYDLDNIEKIKIKKLEI